MNRLVAQAASLLYRRLPVGGTWDKTQAPQPASGQQVGNQLCSARRTLAAFWLSLPARHERGESRREGEIDKKRLLSPAFSSFLRRRGRENAVTRSKQIFCRTQLICDPQQLCRPPSILNNPEHRSPPTCCGSQSRAPDRESVTRSSFARKEARGRFITTRQSTCCGSLSGAPVLGHSRSLALIRSLVHSPTWAWQAE